MIKREFFLDVLMRALAASAIGYFAWQIWLSYDLSHKKTLLFLLLGELITVGLVVFAKPTNTRDFSLLPWLLTMCASFYFFVVYLDGSQEIISQTAAQVIMCAGIFVQILSKFYLGRSFGLLPARRGIVTTGPYRIVRHPIYFGYFIMHMAFLLSGFSIHNLIVYIILYALQFGRIFYEEKKLSEDPLYLEYKKKVKYRFLPLVI